MTGPVQPMAASGGRTGREPRFKGRCDREAGPGAAGGRPGWEILGLGRRGEEKEETENKKIKKRLWRRWRPLK